MGTIAIVVLLAVAAVSVWAWRTAPGKQAADQFIEIWRKPWGKQFYVDFFALEVVLALWMISDGIANHTWVFALVCVITMPVLGSMPAAIYWLAR